jgi:uncharacterized coiled-coil protein SlyX
VPILEERVSFLEGRMVEQSQMLRAIQDAIASLDRRVTALDQKIETKVDALDVRIETKVDALDHKLDQRFAWLMGIQVTTTLALLGAMIALVKH